MRIVGYFISFFILFLFIKHSQAQSENVENYLSDSTFHLNNIIFYKDKIKNKENLCESYIDLSYSYLSLKQYENALSALDSAKTYLDATDKINFYFFYIYTGLAHESMQNIYKALPVYEALVENFPDSAISYYYRGKAKESLSLYKEAILDYMKGLQLSPSDTILHYRCGVTYRSMNMMDSALVHYTLALKVKPDYALALLGKAEVYHHLLDFNKSNSSLDSALLYDNSLEEFVSYKKSLNFLNLFKPDSSIYYINKSLRYSINSDYFCLKGHAFLAKGAKDNYIDIIYNYKKYISLGVGQDPVNLALANSNIGYCYLFTEDYKNALSYLNYAISLDSLAPYAYNNRAFAYLKTGRYEQAATDIAKSLILDPNNAYAYRNRALLYLAENKKRLACLDYKKALSLGLPVDDTEVPSLRNACN